MGGQGTFHDARVPPAGINQHFALNLTAAQKADLVEYLKSL